jgi:hypothetical protein
MIKAYFNVISTVFCQHVKMCMSIVSLMCSKVRVMFSICTFSNTSDYPDLCAVTGVLQGLSLLKSKCNMQVVAIVLVRSYVWQRDDAKGG